MKRILMTLVLLALPCHAVAEDGLAVWNKWKPDMEKAVRAYLKAHSTPEEEKKWNKRMDGRCEERSLQTVALDWFFDHEDALKAKEKEKIKEACFFFIRFIKTNTPPPLQMRSRMTGENFESLIQYLESETGASNDGDPAGRGRGDG